MPFLEHSFDFVAGSCLFSIGEDEKGFDMLREALSAASELAKSEEDYGHLLYFSGALINSYLEVKDFPSVHQESERYENWLKRMQELTPPASEEYIDRCRFYLNMNPRIQVRNATLDRAYTFCCVFAYVKSPAVLSVHVLPCFFTPGLFLLILRSLYFLP